jgi:STE24 endopeptidase
MAYQRAGSRFGILRNASVLVVFLTFVLLGGFEAVDELARRLQWGPIATGLVFAGVLTLLRGALSLPFSIYSTFGIERRFGFNRTTPATFAGDLLKGLLLGAALGAPIFALIIWLYDRAGQSAWLHAWVSVSALQLLLAFVAPAFLFPLFNRFSPLPQGELRNAIEEYARGQGFTLKEMFTMDGSKRSSKANAFFTGFGRLRRLVLFDTLIEKHPTREITAVVAHEVGHFKLGHIPKGIALTLASSGVLFFAFGKMLGWSGLYEAFRLTHPSTYAGLVLASLLYSPLSWIVSFPARALSRRNEYVADSFAAKTYGNAELLASALTRLSVDNSSHLTPHPFKVALDYTHPPVVERIRALRKLRST